MKTGTEARDQILQNVAYMKTLRPHHDRDSEIEARGFIRGLEHAAALIDGNQGLFDITKLGEKK
jgi:hypothetical protein